MALTVAIPGCLPNPTDHATERRGIGGKLLSHLRELANKPLLIGTWADAKWAIKFYERHGFGVLSAQRKDHLLRKYWKISQRQAETSVVFASPEWLRADPSCGQDPLDDECNGVNTLCAAKRILSDKAILRYLFGLVSVSERNLDS